MNYISLLQLDKILAGINFERFVRIVTKYAYAGYKSGERAGREESKSKAPPNRIQDKYVLNALQEKQIQLSNKTRARLVGDLRKTLWKGSENLESIDEISKRVKAVFRDFEDFEAERVARTEIMSATNKGRNDAWNRNPGVQYKIWHNSSIGSKRTALDTKRMFGQIQDKDKPFIDPQDGRAYSMPPMRPNDRCTAIPLTKLPKDIIYIAGQRYDASKAQPEARVYM